MRQAAEPACFAPSCRGQNRSPQVSYHPVPAIPSIHSALRQLLPCVAQAVEAALAALTEEDLKCQQGALERDGQFVLGDHVITSAMVDIKPEQRKLSGRCAP